MTEFFDAKRLIVFRGYAKIRRLSDILNRIIHSFIKFIKGVDFFIYQHSY